MIDDRQYRDYHVCYPPDRTGGGSIVGPECTARVDPARSLLGHEQEAWLARQLTTSPAGWNLLAQQTLMASLDVGGERFTTDGWDGYPAARQRLVDVLGSGGVRNPVIIGGDVHTFYAADLHARPGDSATPVVAPEFVGGSISSLGAPQNVIDRLLPQNPHIKLARSDCRGFALVEVDRAKLDLRMQKVDNALERDSGVSTLARYVVENGNPRMAQG
jgi:alkaline phosphatase D